MTTPFFLVTGFLGSGKTTLLKRVLARHADGRRVAVIQNEFADVNVDGHELRRTGKPFHLLEVNKGSVFCVCLLADFTRACAAMVREVNPDAVILEATGLADPIAVGQVLQSPELRPLVHLAAVWTVVDAPRFLKMEAAVTRITHQVRVADTVIVNKTDLVGPATVAAIVERVRTINPFCRIQPATRCDVDVRLDGTVDGPCVAVRCADALSCGPAAARPPVASAVVRTTRRISRAGLSAFLDARAPGSYRIKGFVNLDDCSTVAVHCVGEQREVVEVGGYAGPTELVILAPEVDAVAVAQEFEGRCARS